MEVQECHAHLYLSFPVCVGVNSRRKKKVRFLVQIAVDCSYWSGRWKLRRCRLLRMNGMPIDKVWLLVLAATEFASLMVQSLDPMVDGGRSRGR